MVEASGALCRFAFLILAWFPLGFFVFHALGPDLGWARVAIHEVDCGAESEIS
jgi:hypothetical protein